MTNKELRKLTKEDLLELLIGQAKSAESQQKEIDYLTARVRKLEEENERGITYFTYLPFNETEVL